MDLLCSRSRLTVMVVLALLPSVGILVGSTERVEKHKEVKHDQSERLDELWSCQAGRII